MSQARTWKKRHTSEVWVNNIRRDVIHTPPETFGATLVTDVRIRHYVFPDCSEVVMINNPPGLQIQVLPWSYLEVWSYDEPVLVIRGAVTEMTDEPVFDRGCAEARVRYMHNGSEVDVLVPIRYL
jgi:hypothetical protein